MLRYKGHRFVGVMCVLLITLIYGSVTAQELQRFQNYQLIRRLDSERAGNIRWVELWESQDKPNNARQLVMIDAQGRPQGSGVDARCYFASSTDNGIPTYIVDNERIPVSSASMLWEQLENRRLFNQSQFFVKNWDCQPQGSETVNGFETQHCTFENVDATGLFLVRPPATSTGDLWTAANGSPVRYRFEAEGADAKLLHKYEMLVPPENFVIVPTGDTVNLLCFDSSFPMPRDTKAVSFGSLTRAAFDSSLTREDLVNFYDSELKQGSWVKQKPADAVNGPFNYSRVLPNGSKCEFTLSFTGRSGAINQFSAEVFPSYATADNLPLPENLPETFSLSATNATLQVDGSVADAIQQFLPNFLAEGWVQRDELTDIRDNSAFITLARDDYEMHVIIDSGPGRAFVQIQTRSAACGPTFDAP